AAAAPPSSTVVVVTGVTSLPDAPAAPAAAGETNGARPARTPAAMVTAAAAFLTRPMSLRPCKTRLPCAWCAPAAAHGGTEGTGRQLDAPAQASRGELTPKSGSASKQPGIGAAVDLEGDTGHEFRLLRAQEGDHRTEVRRIPEAPCRDRRRGGSRVAPVQGDEAVG